MLANDLSHVCAACGLPPQPGEKLLRCSRCHGAFYHDRECQKKHFSSHRKLCRPAASSLLCYEIKKSNDRGRYLIATRSIVVGESIPASKDPKSTLFHPVVQPVLLTGKRRTHCAICFGLRDKDSIRFSDCSKYEVFVCSTCSPDVDTKCTLTEETSTISRLVDTANEIHGENNMKVLPTAVLVFRILAQVARGNLAWDTISTMQTHYAPSEVPEHSMAVEWTVSQLLHMTTQHPESLRAKIQPTLHRIRYNSFTITDPDAEAIGIGLYSTPAHLLNHSCRPNARQSFVNGIDLKISTIESIPSGEEITITYGAVDIPVSERRDELYKNYKFHCNCRRCSAELC